MPWLLAMILNMQDKQVLVFLEEGFQPPLPSQCWEMMKNLSIFFYLFEINSAWQGLTGNITKYVPPPDFHILFEFFLSGASMNRVRSPSPTVRARVPVTNTTPRSAPQQPKMERLKLIDLYNFEDPRNDNSKYVLTSPRSLEACSRLNIKVCVSWLKFVWWVDEKFVYTRIKFYTIRPCYSTVQCILMLHTMLQQQQQNMNKT